MKKTNKQFYCLPESIFKRFQMECFDERILGLRLYIGIEELLCNDMSQKATNQITL